MKVPPLSLVGMERLPLPLPFSPELLWRYNPLGPPSHHHGPHPPNSAAAAVFSRAAAAAASIPSPLAQQLPFAYDIKHTIPLNLGEHGSKIKLFLSTALWFNNSFFLLFFCSQWPPSLDERGCDDLYAMVWKGVWPPVFWHGAISDEW